MELYTRERKAREAVGKFCRHYKGTDLPGALRVPFLEALPEHPSPDDVDRIIGNKTWTLDTCSECKNIASPCVRVGDEPSYESDTAWLCKECVRKAWELIKDA